MYVTVLPETARLKEEIRKAVNQAERQGIKIGVEADTVDADKELKRFRTTQERNKIRQKIEFDEGDLKSKLNLISKEFDGVGSKIGSALKFNLGFAAVGTLPAFATALTNVAGAIQQLAGAGLALPGIFAGLGSSFGVAKLGTMGMKDALDALNKSADGTQASVDAANKALDGLAPNVADTVREVYGLKGTFEDLRDISGQNLFAGASQGLRELAGNLLPTATRGIDGISKALNQNLLQAMSSLGSGSSQGLLDRIFGNTADAQGKLTGAIDPIIHAFEVLAAAGTDSLPRLATAVGAVADRFNKFITGADADGRLEKWISDGLDGFTQLGNIVLNIGKSFTALTQAAGGGAGLLSLLQSATAQMSTFLNSTEGQNKLKAFFADGRQMLGELVSVAREAGPVLGGAFAAARDMAGMWLPIIREVLHTINSIPGGAQAVVVAFVAWKTMSGISSLVTSLTTVVGLLGRIPGLATSAAGGMTALSGASATAATSIAAVATAAAALPAAVAGFLAVGQHIYQTASDAQKSVAGTNVTTDDIAQGRTGGRGTQLNDAHAPLPNIAGGGGAGAQAARRGGVPYTGLPALGSAGGGAGAQAARRGNTAVPAAAAMPTVPIPPLSSYSAPVVTDYGSGGGGGGGGGKTAADFLGGYTSDAALLANVPAGRYTGGEGSDLTTGLADCSSAVEDLVNLMDGTSTAGRSMATGNEAQWLTQHGFMPGMGGPGDMRVGFNSEHTQATLPGGTPFNWGSNAAAARGGVGGTGADDPAFTQHYYRPTAGSSALSGAYPDSSGDLSGYMNGDPTHDKRIREAGQRVDDTQQRMQSAQARVDELNAKGTATARQRADAEAALAKAKREHGDAQTDLNTALQKGDALEKGGAGKTGGEQLGQDILSGMGQVFGLGDLFKDPTQFGLFKILKGVMGLKFADDGQTQGGDGASLFGGGGGGGGPLGVLTGLIQQPFGDLKSGSPTDAPGQFMPTMPNSGGGGIVAPGGILADPNSPPGVAGPGNNGSYNDFRGANFGHSPAAVQQGVDSAHLRSTRQPLRSLPGP